MIYKYVCSCGKNKDIDIPFGQDLPKDIKCDCGKIMKHDFVSKFKENTTIIIPDDFKAANADRYKYQKHYGKMNPHEKTYY